MGRRHNQLTLEERHALFRLHAAGTAVGAIAARLGRHRATIYRELGRNRRADGSYLPETAQRFAWARRLRGAKLERRSQLGELVRDRLAMGWSPEQIAGRLRLEAAQHRIAASPSTAGSTARSAGASACTATWRAPSRAGDGGRAAAGASRRS